MAEPVLQVQGLHVNYRVKSHSFEVLHDIDLDVAAGSVVGIVGESGCGKSTLASAMMRLLPPNGRVTSGRLALHGRDLLTLSCRELREVRGREIGMIFQDPLTSLNPTFRVSTQMINAQRAHADTGGRRRDELRAEAVRMLERVGIPDPQLRIDDYPHQFSGGMRQRIIVATTLLLQPNVLICDEATSALDVTIQAQILQILTELCREQGTALVVISHDIGVISQLADQVLVLYAGRVVESGAAAEVLQRPQHPYTRKLLAAVPSRHRRDERLSTIPGRVPSLAELPAGCTFADRCHAAQDACTNGEPPLVDVAGRQVRCLPEVRDAAPSVELPGDAAPAASGAERESSVLVRTEQLRVHFAGRRGLLDRLSAKGPTAVRAVDGVDLGLDRGEIVGLVGESGSGKTTLGKALLRLVPVTGGQVVFDGTDIATLDRRRWRGVRRGLQMIFQEPYGSLSPRLRVDQLVTEPYRINKTPPQDQYGVDELLGLVGLAAEQATKYPHELSGGQARRVGIARALAMQPAVVVADEPTAGLDVSAAAAILNLLQDLRDRLSLTLLIITHDLNVVGYVADRIAVMKQGAIVEIDTADRVMDVPQHPYTRDLLAAIPELPHDAPSSA
ncbi:MAG: dipeptide ABC transporter ATP-binding protein [Streptosporangiales bacterium]|nr:dipeptide ABC transporter ATP-binding protein [Streptosporangiales bacterium]